MHGLINFELLFFKATSHTKEMYHSTLLFRGDNKVQAKLNFRSNQRRKYQKLWYHVNNQKHQKLQLLVNDRTNYIKGSWQNDGIEFYLGI